MRRDNSAITDSTIAVDAGAAPRSRSGLLLAALGVLCFSLTFPSTAWGLESFGPWSLVCLRCVLATAVAAGFLRAVRARVPARAHWAGIAVVAGGGVLGFPLLTTLALQTSTTAHSAVVVGLLPLTTALVAAARSGVWPPRAFWPAAGAGAAIVLAFTLGQGGGGFTRGDVLLFAALLVCAASYAEGGRLAAVMPGWQVSAWALVACLPLTGVGAVVALCLEHPVRWSGHGVAGLVWVSVGSTFVGLFVWYRGMAETGVARASQLQLAQPLLTLVWSVTLLGESLPAAAPLAAVGVVLCIAGTQWATRAPRTARPAPYEEPRYEESPYEKSPYEKSPCEKSPYEKSPDTAP
ncbi:integral membrane protein [Streptomyces sp. SPB78]|uniref:DMT family transporter n=1 Tax=Streptomyces sp. (strain SPB78) TaxID=591157 RepID=UPI0001DED54C|nr:DMT family transporter [Streptomyces sp. SPB78]EFK98769.1 integral membrane protein [Streptomyces sp. SPB78]